MSEAKKEKKEIRAEYSVYNNLVQVQPGDIYKVTCKGTCVEFTNRYTDAVSVFNGASKPKQLHKVSRGTGVGYLLKEEIV